METTEKSIEVLNDLIEINNDRVKGFEKAIEDLEDGDFELQGIFDKLKNDSRNNAAELASAVSQAGGEADLSSSASGAIHRAWIDVKATFGGTDRKSILEECERGEDAIKKAYRSALEPDSELSPEFTEIVVRQQQGINAGHDQIKMLRDTQ